MRYITQETFDALVAHFAEYRECNPTPLVLATMALQTLGISIEEDIGDEEEGSRERCIDNAFFEAFNRGDYDKETPEST